MIGSVLQLINNKTINEAVSEIDSLIEKREPSKYVLFANLNHLAKIRNEPLMRKIYKEAHMVLPDGKYVYWLSRLFDTPLREYIRGLDLFYEICKLCAAKQYKCMMVGGKPGSVGKAKGILVKKYPGLQSAETFYYPLGDIGQHIELDNKIINTLGKEDIDVLFLGLGTPREQAWIDNYKNGMRCVIIGVGSVFDYTAGEIVEAPRFFQSSGLEWFWRFLNEPQRLWKRYFIENILFAIDALCEIFRKKILVRKNYKNY